MWCAACKCRICMHLCTQTIINSVARFFCVQVPASVLKELQPFITLAEGLGKAAVSLVADSGFTDLTITYSSPRGDDLDTRLLRAMVIKGVLEGITTAQVNLVNADLLAKNRGLKITETNVRSEGR